MAAEWHLIGNAQPLIGRSAEAGDLRGSALASYRVARRQMEMCLLQAHRYGPYPRWFGTAFSRLPRAEDVGPLPGDPGEAHH